VKKSKYISPKKEIEMECVDCECSFIITPKEWISWNGQCFICHSYGISEIVDPMLEIHKLKEKYREV
jgi:hypothetical protein